MKYIVTEDSDGKEEIFLFPRSINHDCMAEALKLIKNHTRRNWVKIRRDPISAGFVSHDNKCYGESESLGLKSRHGFDTEILRTHLEALR